MKLKQINFALLFVMEYVSIRLARWSLATATWAMEHLVRCEEYAVHVLVYRRRLGGLYLDPVRPEDTPDGVLWVRNELAGQQLIPVPFWLSNRYLAKVPRLTPAMDFNIRSLALKQGLLPSYVGWKAHPDLVEAFIESANDCVCEYNLTQYQLNHQ